MPSILFFIFSLFFILGTFAGINKLFFFSLFLSLIFLRFKNKRGLFLKFLLFSIFAFLAGYFYFILRTPIISPQIIKSLKNRETTTVEIVSEPRIYETYQKFVAKIQNVKIQIFAPIFYQINYGDIIEIASNLESVLDQKQNLQGIFLKGFAKKIEKKAEHKTILSTIFKLKKSLELKLSIAIPPEPFEIISGLLYGKDMTLPELKSAFKNAGLSHLTAMSGYNLTVISSAIFNFLRYFAIPKFLINFSSILFLAVFVIFAGAQGSIVRAFIMSIILILIRNSGRIPLSRNILLGAALLISLINPANIFFDLGFQLSFLATIGIIYLAPNIEERLAIKLHSPKKFLIKTIAETLGAQIMVLPLIWYQFGELNIFSFFTNLIVLPLIPFFMFLGFITIIFIFIPLLPLILSYSFSWLSVLIKYLSNLPMLYLNPPFIFIIFIYLYLFYLIYQFNKNALPDFYFNIR